MTICSILISFWLLLITIIGTIILIISYFIISLGLAEFMLFRETVWYSEKYRDLGDKRDGYAILAVSYSNKWIGQDVWPLPDSFLMFYVKMQCISASCCVEQGKLTLSVWLSASLPDMQWVLN